MACVRARVVAGLLLLVAALAGGPAAAQGEQANAVMSEKAYKSLSAAHAAIDEQDYGDAVEHLKDMEQMTLSEYEKALVLQTYGYIYAENGRYDDALRFFEFCIALYALPPRAQQDMLYSLASLYANQERWIEAVETIELWLEAEPDPPPESYILIASSYSGLKSYQDALTWVEKAIAAAEEPQESWYQLMVACYFELKEFARAAAAARTMVSLWPENRSYWQMLQGAHQELGQDVEAMSALELGYSQGVLIEQDDILNLARMKLFLDVPFDAAEILTREMQGGRVERTTKNLELLLAAWEAAREFERAIGLIDELATKAATGKLFARKAQLYSERNRWDDAIVAADQSLERGGLSTKEQGTVLLLKGVAQLELERREDAQSTFVRASSLGGRVAEQARSWIRFIKDQALTLNSG